MVPTKKECADQNFIWGIEDKHMLTEVKSSNLKPSKKDEAITYIMWGIDSTELVWNTDSVWRENWLYMIKDTLTLQRIIMKKTLHN